MAFSFSILLMIPIVAECVLEHSVINFNLQKCRIGIMLADASFTNGISVRNIMQCAKECLYIRRCKSFNYHHVPKMCLFNQLNSTELGHFRFVEDNEYTYCNRKDLPKEIAGTCSSSPCSFSEKCLPSSPYQCVGYCGIPDIKAGAFKQTQCETSACGNTYTCTGDSAMSKHSTCKANGRWSKAMLRCINMSSCQDVLNCNPYYGDGEYWLEWGQEPNIKWVKIFCANMRPSGYTLKEYLTLPNPSTVEHSGNIGYCSKVGIDMTNLKLKYKDIRASGRTRCMSWYAVFSANIGYGCEAYSYTMTLDMRGTGLLIQPLPIWTFTLGEAQPINVEYIPNTGNKSVFVYGNMSDNSYGRVEPTGGIYLVVDENESTPNQTPAIINPFRATATGL